MSVKTFRILLMLSWILAITSGCVDSLFPQLLSESLHQAYSTEFSGEYEFPDFMGDPNSLGTILVWAVFIILCVIFLISIIIGFFLLKGWARIGTLILTVLGLIGIPFTSGVIMSGLAYSLVSISSMLFGVVMVASYYSQPLASYFNKTKTQ